MARNSRAEIAPAASLPMPSFTSLVMISLFPSLPGVMGPPVTKTVGRSRRAAAINMPGTILSQLQSMTSPSN